MNDLQLHKCFLQVKEYREKLKSCEQELQVSLFTLLVMIYVQLLFYSVVWFKTCSGAKYLNDCGNITKHIIACYCLSYVSIFWLVNFAHC